MNQRRIRNRVDLTVRTGQLALGDVLAIATFVVAGMTHHGIDPATRPGRVIGTLAPFLIGWAVVAPALGLYRATERSSLASVATRTFGAWIAAVPLALVLRASAVFPGKTPTTFVIVTVVVGGAIVTGWRLLAAVVGGRWTGGRG